jgi:hypothetical protein
MTKKINDSPLFLKGLIPIINNSENSCPVYISFTVDVFYAFPHIIALFQDMFALMWKKYLYAQVRF